MTAEERDDWVMSALAGLDVAAATPGGTSEDGTTPPSETESKEQEDF